MNELWTTMAELTSSKLEPSYTSVRSGDVPHSLADISAARRDLRFDPQIDVREGLKRTLEFYVPVT